MISLYLFITTDSRPELNKLCESLVNMEITKEDVLQKSESEVDSTTEDTPVKKPKILKEKQVNNKKKINFAKAQAAAARAKEIFNSNDTDELRKEIESLKKQLEQKCKSVVYKAWSYNVISLQWSLIDYIFCNSFSL